MCSLTGRVLNRFAKDVGFLDDLLPYIFLEYLTVSAWLHACLYIIALILPHVLISAAGSEVSVVFGPNYSDTVVHHLPCHFAPGWICVSAVVLS